MTKLFIETKSTKDGKGTYTALYADYGYAVSIVTMETEIIAELADLKISQVKSLEPGNRYVIGEVVLVTK